MRAVKTVRRSIIAGLLLSLAACAGEDGGSPPAPAPPPPTGGGGTVNAPPVVSAGPDQTVASGATVTLTGSASDPGGSIASVMWSQTAGPNAPLTNATTESATFTAPQVSQATTLSFRLTATDNQGATASDGVDIVINPPSTSAAQSIGSWRELILNPDGSINPAEYFRVAMNYNTAEMLDYRLGPTAADFGNNAARPTIPSPDRQSTPRENGLWSFGTQPTSNPGEPEKCVLSEFLPRSDQEERDRGFQGGAWIIGGQYQFLPDPANTDARFRFGISNIRTADGVLFNTGGLCMRQRAFWEPDWWNRNNVSRAATPAVEELVTATPSTPLPAVAIARAKGNVGHLAFAAFRDGRIVPMRVGNSGFENDFTAGVQLPSGMVPTAMQVSAYNEFLYVTVWDTNAATPTGRLGVIALRPRQMAVGDPSQTPNTRYYWGLPGAWTVTGMKLLGFIDLPFAAPTSLDVYNNVILGSPRGHNDNDAPAVGDLAQQSARDRWFNAPVDPFFNDRLWQQNPRFGYAIVASRAEGRVAFIDLSPLFRFYRDRYMTTAARFSETKQAAFPFTFADRPEQRPVVAEVINVQQPTAVRTGQLTNTIFGLTRTDFFIEFEGERDRRFAARRAFVASMDGQVRIFDVTRLITEGSTAPIAEIGSFAAGRNPVSFAETSPLSTAPDDLFVISRGDRRITFAFPDGRIQGVLEDSRLDDPVGATVGVNLAGFGGSGVGRAVFAVIITVADYNGKALTNYAVEVRRGSRGSLNEQYPFVAPGGAATLFLYGFKQPTPGKPIAVSIIEII